MRISQKQILEWSENPVTIRLKEEAEKEITEIQQMPTTDCLYLGEPQKTQENLIELEARMTAWMRWVEFLDGDWTYFEDYFEEDEDE